MLHYPLSPRSPKGLISKKIYPILQDECTKCHRKEHEIDGKIVKPRHNLRVDQAAGILKRDKEYPNENVNPGKPAESWLVQVITLPKEDDLSLPPEGKADPVSDAERALLEKRVVEGAGFGGWEGAE